MPRTSDAWFADSPQTGGVAFAGAGRIIVTPATVTPAFYRVANGVYGTYSVYITGAGTAVYWQASFGNLVRRVLPATGHAPGETPIPKGIRPKDIFLVYNNTINALNAGVARLYAVTFVTPETTTPTVTNIPLNTVTFPIGATSNIRVITVPVTNPAFITNDTADLIAEFSATPVSGAVVYFYGIGMHFDYNFN